MIKPELLSPCGDFDCVKAAVQNGADAIYFGGDVLNARTTAKNFSTDEMKEVINYCILRNVKTYLTLNTLVKNDEFEKALEISKNAYEYGIDGIIVQDIGLASFLLKNLPDLPIHGSTQMCVHNLEGALYLEKLGFKRVVLSRELTINEIAYICRNTKIEIEVFVHGALCISYSGQCLFSSSIGGRSGNRGKCAGPCRLSYTLLEEKNDKYRKIDNGYLLSTRDLNSLEVIPELINAGVKCFKIEGRLKSPEYVGLVTSTYRKYIDLALSKKNYLVKTQDVTNLMQVFNRGGFSLGHLDNNENKNLVYSKKPNHTGLNIGTISNYNSRKGLVFIKSSVPLNIGDTVSFENEHTSYKISELMDENKTNIKKSKKNQSVYIGRMKGNIKLSDKVYKLSDIELKNMIKQTYDGNIEHKKIKLFASITVKKDMPIVLNIHDSLDTINISTSSNYIPEEAINKPITEEIIIKQLRKTNNSVFEFSKINVELDDNLFLPKLSILNDIRRKALEEATELIINSKQRTTNLLAPTTKEITPKEFTKRNISILLQTIDASISYEDLPQVKNIYIPFKYFTKNNYKSTILELQKHGNIYVYLPTIIKANYKNLFINNIQKMLEIYQVEGFVVSNVADFELLKKYKDDYKLIGNYTLNTFNSFAVNSLRRYGLSKITLSSELDKEAIIDITKKTSANLELMVYGNIPIMNLGYCLLGKSNKCYPTCSTKCANKNNKYYLLDRLNYKFQVIPDNIQTITSIYNSKITSFDYRDIPIQNIRLNFLNESICEMIDIINKISENKLIKGSNYTNGNINKKI